MILHGDCLEVMKRLCSNSVDSIVTDPPYGLSFMGKKWDYDVPSTDIWKEALRVLKPGGHLLAFFGTRTYHRGAIRIEDAGFEIRDQIQWIYGSGFPKSKNIGDGFGTALKPANEPIVVARKPLEKGLTVAQNVLKWGTGAINIDGSRIGLSDGEDLSRPILQTQSWKNTSTAGVGSTNDNWKQGRWPANVLFDEEAAQMLDEQSGTIRSAGAKSKTIQTNSNTDLKFMGKAIGIPGVNNYADSGGASRFFYVAKASKRERNAGLEGMVEKSAPKFDGGDFVRGNDNNAKDQKSANFHPTVKPIKLMEYLITLVTPHDGSVLDPFMGSGSTGVAAKNLNRKFIGIEMSEEYFEIAKKRIG